MTTELKSDDRKHQQVKAMVNASKASASRATMQSIAELAGVSAMTVSRALKHDTSVSKSTRERVLKIVHEIGYVPDATARVFASGNSGFVAVLVPSINNSNFADTLHGMTQGLESAGLQILLGDTGYSFDREEQLIATLLQRRPEAIVLTGGAHTPRARQLLSGAEIPIVETWDLPEAPLAHVVGFSNMAAGEAMTRHLLERGYRRIGFIGGTTNADTRGSERRSGYMRVIASLGGQEPRAINFGVPPVTMDQGSEALVRLLQQWPDTDAVVCVSDVSAFGALMECHRRGIRVPNDLAIVGFGDFDLARSAWPRLTTIAIDCADIGERTARIVLESLEAAKRGERLSPQISRVSFKLIERETT